MGPGNLPIVPIACNAMDVITLRYQRSEWSRILTRSSSRIALLHEVTNEVGARFVRPSLNLTNSPTLILLAIAGYMSALCARASALGDSSTSTTSTAAFNVRWRSRDSTPNYQGSSYPTTTSNCCSDTSRSNPSNSRTTRNLQQLHFRAD